MLALVLRRIAQSLAVKAAGAFSAFVLLRRVVDLLHCATDPRLRVERVVAC